MVNRQFFDSLPQPRFRPGLPEIEGMLELYPDATLLVDFSNWRILTANAKAVELASFTRSELQHLKLAALFANWEEHPLYHQPANETDTFRYTLTPRNKSSLEVHVKLIHISSSGKWALLSIIPNSVLQQRELEQQSSVRLVDGVKKISQALQQSSLDDALQTILSAAQAISGAAFLSIYQANGKDLELFRVAQIGSLEVLPEKFSG